MEQQNFPNGMADMISELAKNPAVMSTLASLLPTLLSSAGSGSSEKKEEAQTANAAPSDPIYLSPDAAKEGGEIKEPAPAPVPDIRAAGSGRALLLALKPYLSEERRSKLDRIASLSDVLEAMGGFSRKGGE